MKKLAVLSAMLLFSVFLLSNPMMPPPVMSELYWDESGWTMELYFYEVFFDLYDLNSMDDLSLVCNNDTSAFVTGIPIEEYQIVVVTINDLVDPFEIPISGGAIEVLYNDDLYPITEILAYGNHDWSRISPVTYGQSIVNQKFIISSGGAYTIDYWLVKETQPSIGSLPFTCQTRANFSGLVLDKAGLPVPNASIIYTFTDTENFDPPIPEIITGEDGTFSTDQMFCREYTIKVYVDGQMELITQLNIEPGSANYFEFSLDSLYVGYNEVAMEPKISMTTNPNPFNSNLHVNIQMDAYKSSSSAKLELMDLNGKIWKHADINASYLHHIDVYWNNMNQLIMNPGVYILVLEVDGRMIASHKVIFQQ